MSIPPAFVTQLQIVLKERVQNVHPVFGGNISAAWQLVTPSGQYFLKTNGSSWAQKMFEAEATGLRTLRASQCIRAPEIIHRGVWEGESYLLLEWIDEGLRPDSFWTRFGNSLAELHRCTSAVFGLKSNNYIGALPQSNRPNADWPLFYREERLLPQVRLAASKNRLESKDLNAFEHLWRVLPELLPREKPSLIHGDLWSGNFLAAATNEAVLIDPSICYAHREMDLAMSRLFGGFPPEFYEAYEANFPLLPNHRDRIEIYQLYYLLVHVNLFGTSYLPSVQRIIYPFLP